MMISLNQEQWATMWQLVGHLKSDLAHRNRWGTVEDRERGAIEYYIRTLEELIPVKAPRA